MSTDGNISPVIVDDIYYREIKSSSGESYLMTEKGV